MTAVEARPVRARSPRPRLIIGPALAGGLAAVLVAALTWHPGGGPTVGAVYPLVRALAGLGEVLGRWLPAHPLAVSSAIAAVLAATALAPPRRASGTLREDLPALLAVAGLFAAMAAFAGGLLGAGVTASLALGALLAARAAGARRLDAPTHTRELLLLILLAAAVLRFVALAEHAPGFGTHGSVHLELALDLYERVLGGPATGGASQSLARMLWPMYVSEQHGPMAVVSALGFALFGIGFVQARMTQALLGVLTVWVAYLFGRRLRDERLGLILAFLLAFSPWHVAISRFNDAEHVLATLQALLALTLVLRAFPSGSRRDAVLAGLVCAAGWYVYATNQVLLGAIALFLLWLAVARRRSLWADRWRAPLFALSFAAASLPHIVVSIQRGRYLLLRTSYSTDGHGIYALVPPHRMLSNLGPALRELLVQVDDQWFSLPAGGGLGVVEGALAAGGILLCLLALARRPFRDRALLLLLWLVTGFLPAILLAHVEFRRLLLVALLTTVLAALVLAHAGELLAASRGGRRLLAVLAPPAVLAFAAVNTHVYFDRVSIPETESATYFTSIVTDLRAHVDEGTTVFVLPSDGRMGPEHERSLRLGAYDILAARLGAGVPRDRIYRLVRVGELEPALRELRSGPQPVRVVMNAGLLEGDRAGQPAAELLHRLAPEVKESVVSGLHSRPELVLWTLPPLPATAGEISP